MFIAYLLQWWYGAGWLSQWQQIKKKTAGVASDFSGRALLKTLFAPWKRVTTQLNRNATIGQKFQAKIDNLVSRVVGFFVRIFVLLAELVILVVVFVFYLLLAIIWPILPVFSLAAPLLALGVI